MTRGYQFCGRMNSRMQLASIGALATMVLLLWSFAGQTFSWMSDIAQPQPKIGVSDIAHVTMTHSSCKDVWPATWQQLQHARDPRLRMYVFNDELIPDAPAWIVQKTYQKGIPFGQKVEPLAELPEPYVLFAQEDMFPLRDIDYDKILPYLEKVVEAGYSFLMFGGPSVMEGQKVGKEPVDPRLDLWRFEDVYIQPRIWVKSKLIDYVRQNANVRATITPAEFEGAAGQTAQKLPGLAHWNATMPRHSTGLYEDFLYPYTATGVVQGLWDTLDYPFLLDWAKELGIDISKRGEFFCWNCGPKPKS